MIPTALDGLDHTPSKKWDVDYYVESMSFRCIHCYFDHHFLLGTSRDDEEDQKFKLRL